MGSRNTMLSEEPQAVCGAETRASRRRRIMDAVLLCSALQPRAASLSVTTHPHWYLVGVIVLQTGRRADNHSQARLPCPGLQRE